MIAILLLALVVGMHHALETDHLAAVSSLISGRKKMSDMVRHGLTWGLGHTLTLFIFSAVAIFLGREISPDFSEMLESAVGVMLIGLGLHVFWRLRSNQVHFQAHNHNDAPSHFHVHSHQNHPVNKVDPLQHRYELHQHEHRFNWRTLLVGMTHGMAGSAALLLLAVNQYSNPLVGLAYILVFGLGSMLGMGLVTAALSIPLSLTAKFLTVANTALQFIVGSVTIVVGSMTLYGFYFVAT